VSLQPPAEGERRSYDTSRLVRNFQAAVLGEAVARGASFFASIVVARTVSTADFGRFSFVVAVVSVGLLVSDVGLQIVATRAIAGERDRAPEYVSSVLLLGSAFALLAYAALAAAGLLKLLPLGVTQAALIFGIALFLAPPTNAWASHLRAFERQDLIYLAQSIASLVLLGSVLYADRHGASLKEILALWVASFTLRLVLVVVFLTVAVDRPRGRFDRAVLRAVAVSAPAAAIAYILQGAYSHVDVVLLGFLVSARSVGSYAAAYRLIDGVTFLTGGAATAAVFPVFARLTREEPRQLARLYGTVMRLLTVLLAPISLILVALAGPMVTLVFGRGHEQTADLFALLAPSTVLIALNFVAAYVSIATGRMHDAIVCTGAAAVVNVVANLVGVPVFGTMAAAVATFLAEVVMLTLLQRALAAELEGACCGRAIAAAATLATCGTTLVLMVPDSRVTVGCIGAAASLPLLRAFRAFDKSDGDRLRHAVAVASFLRR
jgi:O-antigen/teichoic acid export membrane protein